jgi:hypothetical protein
VVLEPGECVPLGRSQLAVEEDVPDHARAACGGVEVEDARARKLDAGLIAVEMAEELIAAADGERGRPVIDRLAKALASSRQVRSDERLLAILAAADVEEVVLARDERITERHGPHLELDPSPRRPLSEDRDVAPVGVDVQVLRVEMPQNDLHGATVRPPRPSR